MFTSQETHYLSSTQEVVKAFGDVISVL